MKAVEYSLVLVNVADARFVISGPLPRPRDFVILPGGLRVVVDTTVISRKVAIGRLLNPEAIHLPARSELARDAAGKDVETPPVVDQRPRGARALETAVSGFLNGVQPVVAIEWIDSFGCPAGWEFEDEVEPKTTTVKTIGFLLRETDDFLFIAPHLSTASERRQIAGHMAVPRRQIIRATIVTSFSCRDAG